MKTIVLDPGHGGYDNGATNGSRLEKNDNLRLGLAVRNKLLQQGQKVIMTRETDMFIPLAERSAISNRNNPDIFVSLHRNAAENPAANGVENWIQLDASPAAAAYAQTILNHVVAAGVQSNRGVRAGNFSVLRNTIAPANLFELGFISNETDNLLFDSRFDEYATAITRGILDALGEPYTPPGQTGSEAIRAVQARLNANYNTGLTVDGVFGPRTKRALIIALQIELNRTFNAQLVADGVFGPRTKTAVPNLLIGSSGNLVYLLQAALYGSGYPVSIDGVFGSQTQQAVRQFQADHGLIPDGIAGPNTFAALFA